MAALLGQNPTRTTTVLLAIAIAAHESATSKMTWRNPGRDAVTYFTALSEWGYTLSAVEGIVLGIEPEPEDSEQDAESSVDEGDKPGAVDHEDAGVPDTEADENA